jgi:NADH-quinone oxidoreductase subunit C
VRPLSSTDNPSSGDDRPEPTPEDLTASPGAQAEIERTDADDAIDEAAGATPGDQAPASDREEIPAPGAPDEPSSDDDGDPPSAVEPSPAAPDGDEGAPESTGVDQADTTATGSEGAGDESSPLVPDQPPPTPSAAADAAVGRQAEAARADKAAQATAAASTAGVEGEPTAAPKETEVVAAEQTAPEPAAEPEPEPEPEPEEIDEARQPLLDALREHLGDDVVATHVNPGVDVWVRVRRDAWKRAAEVCRNELGMTYFGFVSAIDWLPSPFGKSEDGGLGAELVTSEVPSHELEHGTTGGETRFQVIARLSSPTTGLGIHLKADVPDDDLLVESWTSLFAGADWHEREVAEMFGIRFAGHPNPAKLYLPGEFEGYPLRKDFPLLARDVKPWPGLVDVEPMPGEDEPAPAAEADA